MRRRAAMIFLILIFALSLSGCMNLGNAELFSLPKISAEYAQLLDLINDVTSSGKWQTTAPQSGSNRYTMQFDDIFGDGIPEAITFFKNKTASTLRVAVYSKTGSSSYTELCSFDFSGYQINTINYVDLNGDKSHEFILKVTSESSSLNGVFVYGIRNNTAVLLFENTCTEISLFDMDSDELPELLCIKNDETGENAFAELFKYDTTSQNKQIDSLISIGKTEIVSGMRYPDKITTGMLNKSMPVIIADGKPVADGALPYVADILTYRKEKGLFNLSAASDDPARLPALSFYASRKIPTLCTDIDADGFIEFPVPHDFAVSETYKTEATSYLSWYSYNADGSTSEKASTYFAPSSMWYFVFPTSWTDGRNVSLLISKSLTIGNREDGDGVQYELYRFCYEENGILYPLLTIYVLPEDGISQMSPVADAVYIAEADEYAYYAELPRSADQRLPEEMYLSGITHVKQLFYTIDANGNYLRASSDLSK
jgi:hypothetical protein